jgi:hypothetical protein
MTATVVPVRDNRFKMLLQLRAIALLNSTFSQVSHKSHTTLQQINTSESNIRTINDIIDDSQSEEDRQKESGV